MFSGPLPLGRHPFSLSPVSGIPLVRKAFCLLPPRKLRSPQRACGSSPVVTPCGPLDRPEDFISPPRFYEFSAGNLKYNPLAPPDFTFRHLLPHDFERLLLATPPSPWVWKIYPGEVFKPQTSPFLFSGVTHLTSHTPHSPPPRSLPVHHPPIVFGVNVLPHVMDPFGTCSLPGCFFPLAILLWRKVPSIFPSPCFFL